MLLMISPDRTGYLRQYITEYYNYTDNRIKCQRVAKIFHILCCSKTCIHEKCVRIFEHNFAEDKAKKRAGHWTRLHVYRGGTAQSTPDGFARDLPADFSAYAAGLQTSTHAI